MSVYKFILHLCIALLYFASGGMAWACAICAPSAEQNSLVYRLQTSDAAILAKPVHSNKMATPVQAIKGILPDGDVLVADVLPTAAGQEPTESVLLLFNPGLGGWILAGAMPSSRAEWLRGLVGLRPASALAIADPSWPVRVAQFVNDLEHPNPLLAQTAYDEIAVAPYSVMRSLKPHLNAVKLGEWLKSDALLKRRSLYYLLLGFAGDSATADGLERRIKAQSQSLNKAELSSMMAALLELRGATGVEWVETHYLKNQDRSDIELQAAVLALTVHANDGHKVSREKVVQAYAVFIKSNPVRSGFVASDLGNWGRWEFVSDYMTVLKSGVQQAFASRYAIVLYLMRSPSQEARNALEQLRAEGVL